MRPSNTDFKKYICKRYNLTFWYAPTSFITFNGTRNAIPWLNVLTNPTNFYNRYCHLAN